MNRIPKRKKESTIKVKDSIPLSTDRTMTADNQVEQSRAEQHYNQYKTYNAMSLKHSTQKEQIYICPQLLQNIYQDRQYSDYKITFTTNSKDSSDVKSIFSDHNGIKLEITERSLEISWQILE